MRVDGWIDFGWTLPTTHLSCYLLKINPPIILCDFSAKCLLDSAKCLLNPTKLCVGIRVDRFFDGLYLQLNIYIEEGSIDNA